MKEDNIILKVENIDKTFGSVVALNDVSMEIKKSEIHSVIGENGAGKSTLMKIIAGVEKPDRGKIILEGKEIVFRSPYYAKMAGISIVFQELNVFNNLSVADNIFALKQPVNKLGIIKERELIKETEKLGRIFGIDVEPGTLVGSLSLAKKQMVEILRALSQQSKILVMDEPTSSLTSEEAKKLFDILNSLKKEGITIIYISHKIEEVLKISDKITVLRDGKYIETLKKQEASEQKLINMMVGHEFTSLYIKKKKDNSSAIPVLKIKDLAKEGIFKEVSFTLHKNEILGFFGLVGSGRSEIAQSIIATSISDSGEIFIDGRRKDIASPADAIKEGIGYAYEDRKEAGLFLEMSLKDNIIALQINKFTKVGFLKETECLEFAKKYIDELNITSWGPNQKAKTLSGGNQQKLLLAAWIALNPKVLIVDEPTRGIDVGAKTEIHSIIRKLASKGTGIMLISSELSEIIALSDRVVVVREGTVSAILRSDEIAEENIMGVASGVVR
ncbi:MAG: sugar ABC transporter ATP-binding protein [Actinobacteria bacterium]|nr:sugar ABC transporter ATP-binding protein [Actinomycetota bacterium]